MSKYRKLWRYRNDKTGELSPLHRIGEDDSGRPLYHGEPGWTVVDSDGLTVGCEYDQDGNFVVLDEDK